MDIGALEVLRGELFSVGARCQVTAAASRGRRVFPSSKASAVGYAAAARPVPEWSVLEERNQGVQEQRVLEKCFDDFFGKLVLSEWNPCRDDAGRWRFFWDSEIGAHDVECLVDEDLTSEGRAVRDVPSLAPEMINLRSLLDRVFASEGGKKPELDVQRLRRFVALLVNRVGRHTMHGESRPEPGMPCARGDAKCLKCRYGFPLDLLLSCLLYTSPSPRDS